MKKYLWTIAAIAAIVVSGCQRKEDEPVDETPAVLTSFKILAADNEGLKEDYAPASISESMVIRIPGGGQGKTLVATVSAGENDVIKVNDAEVADGKASFDATYAVDIVVTNTKSKKSAQYEVKIGKILQITSKKLCSFESTETLSIKDTYYKANVNPATGEMYLAYCFVPEGGVRTIAVGKFSNGQFVNVGTPGIVPAPTDGSAAVAVSNLSALEFDKDGAPYVLYIGGDVKNTFTLRKFDGSAWVPVGPTGFATKPGTTYSTPSLYFDANGNPGITYQNSSRGSAHIYLDNGEWKDGAINGLPPYVKNGGDRSSNQGIYYYGAHIDIGAKHYGVFSLNYYGLYVYELKGYEWANPIISDYIPAEEPYALPGNLSLAEKDGKLLIFTALNNVKAMQIYEFDGSALTAYGASFSIGVSSSGGVDAARFGVNPQTGEIFAVKTDADKKLYYSIMNADKNWEEFTAIADAPATSVGLGFGFDKSGNALVVYPNANDKGYELYSIGLEDDILPE